MANSRFLFTLPKSVLQWSVEKVCNLNFDHEAYGIKPQNRSISHILYLKLFDDSTIFQSIFCILFYNELSCILSNMLNNLGTNA